MILFLIAILFNSLSHAYVDTRIDNTTGAITTNGTFFYPKIIWNCSDSECLKELASQGFNVAMLMSASITGDPAVSLVFLDNCAKAGLFGICGIGRDVVRDISKLTNYINQIKHHNSLFAISFPDEGTTSYASLGVGNTKQELLNAYNTIKEIAPDLLIVFDHFKEDNNVTWRDIGDIVDAFGVDWYPFVTDPSLNSFHSWQAIMKKLQTETLAGNNCKSIWQFAQGSSTGTFQKAPTYQEMGLQFWASVTYSAKSAFQIYGWDVRSNGMKINPVVRNDVYKLISNDINPNIEWLGKSIKYNDNIIITASKNSDLLTEPNPYVSHICLTYGNYVYVVIVNGHYSKTCNSMSLNISGITDQAATIISSSDIVDPPSIINGTLNIGDIKPFGYRVLKFSQTEEATPTGTGVSAPLRPRIVDEALQ